MWSDDIDKKIQDGAGSHEPPFREEDWDKMHALLDKHLPQEKKKRPILWGFLLFLLVGIPATVMLTTYKSRPENPPFAQTASNWSSTTDETNPNHSAPIGNNIDEKPTAEEKTISGKEPSLANSTEKQIIDSKITAETDISNRATPVYTNSTKRHEYKPSKTTRTKKPDHGIQENSSATGISSVNTNVITNEQDPQPGNVTDAPETITAAPIEHNPDSTKDVSKAAKDSSTEPEPLAKKEKKQGAGNSGKWHISISAGPDLSMVGMEKTGKWRMQYGVGISYAFSDRFQVRSGFMVGRKLYYADSSDYHPPKGFWNYYTNLEKIDANCLVYEIPLNLVYTFPSKKKHQWFVSTGLSSYLMKKETYEYYYKDNWGVPMYRERTIQDENNHFFTILQLSGGYQYKFSDRLSLMAEPYAKLPLSGVGFGKVKLNNTGVLFTLGFKPFVKNK
ncbi:MAG: hypothetical protein DI535_03130 [Citrobacter freundii]|nr:MAG: hypothetical protein DI535_03130 [Citrobacter freundii]